ncbi:MAG: transglutaminase domain-containing protein [Candidatus Brocadiia bacterium]
MTKIARNITAGVLLVVLGLASIGAADKKSNAVSDSWYDLMYQGQKIGHAHSLVEKVKYQGKDCYKFTEEQQLKIQSGQGEAIEQSEIMTCYTSLDFVPIQMTKTEKSKDRQRNVEVVVAAGKIIFKGGQQDKAINFEKGVVFAVNGLLLKNKGLLKPNASATFKVISEGSQSINTENIKVVRQDKVKTGAKEETVFVVESTRSDKPGELLTIVVDSKGVERMIEGSGLKMELTSEENAKNQEKAGTISSSLKTNFSVPFTGRISAMRMKMVLSKESDAIIPETEYQEVTGQKTEYQVVLKEIRVGPDSTVSLPVKDGAFKKYLEQTPRITCNDPVITAKTKDIVKGETDGFKAVKLLTDWIYKNVKIGEGGAATKLAKDILKDKEGNSEEFAILFSSLARAAGLPTRNVIGFMYISGDFNTHYWNEVYLGKWLPVDTMVNRVGCPAIYIKMGEDDDGREESNVSAKMNKLLGMAKMNIESFNDQDRKIEIAEPEKFLSESEELIENALLGMSMPKPSGWKVKNKSLESVTLIGAGEAKIIVSGIEIAEELTRDLFNKTFKEIAYQFFENFSANAIKQTTINGNSAYECLFTGKIQDISIKNIFILTQGNGKTFFIFLSVADERFGEVEGDFKTVVSGLKF